MIHLDTHVALWLVAGEKRRLRGVSKWLRKEPLFVSPIAVLEMELLRGMGRLRRPVADVVAVLTEDYDVEEAGGDLGEVVRAARSCSWTRDPFDRLIVAHATFAKARLLTADEAIRAHCAAAAWAD